MAKRITTEGLANLIVESSQQQIAATNRVVELLTALVTSQTASSTVVQPKAVVTKIGNNVAKVTESKGLDEKFKSCLERTIVWTAKSGRIGGIWSSTSKAGKTGFYCYGWDKKKSGSSRETLMVRVYPDGRVEKAA